MGQKVTRPILIDGMQNLNIQTYLKRVSERPRSRRNVKLRAILQPKKSSFDPD